MERFDAREGIWALVAPMGATRSSLGVAALEGTLWAAGGCEADEPPGPGAQLTLCQSRVECYDPVADRWARALVPSAPPRCDPARACPVALCPCIYRVSVRAPPALLPLLAALLCALALAPREPGECITASLWER